MINSTLTRPRAARRDAALDAAIKSNEYLKNLWKLRSGQQLAEVDAVATGSIFLQSELNKADTRLHMPLEGHTWFRDIPVVNGGGWVDTETTEFVAVGSSNIDGTGTGANDIGVLNFSRSQDVYPTFGWQRSIRIQLIESLKLAQANKSPNDILDKGVRLDFNKTMDQRVYKGNFGKTGLVNSSQVTATAAPNGTQVSPSPSWNTKNPIDIVNDFNSMAQAIWQQSGYDLAAVPDRFGIPASAYPKLLQPMVINTGAGGTTTVAENILEYIKRNYYGLAINGKVPEIVPIPNWLETAGSGNTRRMIGYSFRDDYVNFGLLQNVQRVGGPLSLQEGAFVATYIANTGIVKFLAPQTAYYYDAI